MILKKLLVAILTLSMLAVGCNNCVPYNQTGFRYIGETSNVNHLLNSTVALMIQNPLSGEDQIGCTAFFISPTRLATAEHCVAHHELTVSISADGEPSIGLSSTPPTVGDEVSYVTHQDWIRWESLNHQHIPQPATHLARVTAFDEANDVAVLTIENVRTNSSADWLSIRSAPAQLGEKTYTVGQPLVFRWLLTEGIVSYVEMLPVNEDGSDRLMIGTTNTEYPGSSGSPLIDNAGRVIGVTDMIAMRQPTLPLFTPIVALTRLLQTIPAGH